jgi:hypothetical protein
VTDTREITMKADSAIASNTYSAVPDEANGLLGWPFTTAVAILVIGGVVSLTFGRGQDEVWIAVWGLRLSLWGLFVSIAGFGFTIWQLMRTRSSAIAASDAVQKLRRDFSSLDVILEISSAMAAAKEAQKNLSAGDWRAALSDYNRIRSCIDKSIAAQTGLLPDEINALQDDQAHFLGACDALEEEIRSSSGLFVNVLTARLRRFEGFLTQLDYKIRNRFGG